MWQRMLQIGSGGSEPTPTEQSIIPNMSNYTENGGKVTYNGNSSPAYNAFNDTSSCWGVYYNVPASTSNYAQFEFTDGTLFNPTKCTIKCASITNSSTTYSLYGVRNDNSLTSALCSVTTSGNDMATFNKDITYDYRINGLLKGVRLQPTSFSGSYSQAYVENVKIIGQKYTI